MQVPSSGPLLRLTVAVLLLVAFRPAASGQANPYRGLWVGQVKLGYAAEVTVPLDENNVPIAPDPRIPTPTADQANLRLLLHVNGAGQVSLLKEVAVLNRAGATNLIRSESDLALVSDERLYGTFPPQPAIRHASVVFDFGDSRATEALDEVVNAVVKAVTNSVGPVVTDLTDATNRKNAEDAASLAGRTAASPIVAGADVATKFDQFLSSTNLNSSAVDKIATNAAPATAASGARVAAVALQNQSFFKDSRAVMMVDAVVAAAQQAGTAAQKRKAAQNAAASFADIPDNYGRFLAGKIFGDMMAGAAEAAARAATNIGATEATVRLAANGNSAVVRARSETLTVKVAMYNDTRAADAVDQVFEAIIAHVVAVLLPRPTSPSTLQAAAELAGRGALASNVVRFTVSLEGPTPDYNSFVRSNIFTLSGQVAALAAAQAAVAERRDNTLYTSESLRNVAKVAAVLALRDVYNAAARAVRTELPMMGTFGPGHGDPRLSWLIKQTNGPALGAAALTGTIMLPASHPTNPFRHRRHPDHTVGFDLIRKLGLDFDGQAGEPLARAGFGVDRVTGIYREEILGLHKPLGPNKDTGLKVEGTFELNRISLIDTLNAR